MEIESNDGVTPGKVRHWTTIEEQLLIAILQDLVVEGYKYPNGKFKPGTHELAAEKMRQKMAGVDITFKHVANKMKRWSTKYYAVYDMMITSGFGWDDTNKCVIVDSPQVLQQYLAHHPRGQNFVNKPYPEFEKMQFIFGKDRADGQLAEGTADAVGNMQQDTEMDEFNEDENEVPLNSSASSTTQRVSGSTSRTPKKRPRENDRLIACVEAFAASVKTANNNMTMVAQSFAPPQREHDLVVEELKKMNLTRSERIEATITIAKCPTLTGLFLKMDAHDKVEFVDTVLRG